METVKQSELRVGDIVRSFDGSYSDATVKQVEGDVIHLFRPYVHTSDFIGSGGLICYVGVENFTIFRSDRTITLVQRSKIKDK